MLKNKRGQALIESLFTLPVFIGLVALATIGSFSTGAYYLTDHFVYQSALCLASAQVTKNCEQELKQKLNLIPFSHFSIQQFYKTSQQVRSQIVVTHPWSQSFEFTETLLLPLTSNQFQDAL